MGHATIMIKDETKKELDRRKKTHNESYDSVITRLLDVNKK